MLVQEVLDLFSEVDIGGSSRMNPHLDRFKATKGLLELDCLQGVGAQV